MSGNDDQEHGGELVQFPKVFMPGSFDDTGVSGPEPTGDGDEAPTIGSMPRSLPGVGQMAPPLALTMPGVPTGDGEPAEDDGSLALPMLGDPDNPTARGTLAVAMALMTAMGVAAAQGMWHRARHRQALADQSRAAADRSKASAAGSRASRSTGTSGGSGSLLRSPGGGGSKGSRAFGGTRSGGHGTTGHGSTGRGGKTRPPGVDAAHGPHRRPKRDKHQGAPKAGKGGKPATGPKGRHGKVKGGTMPKPSTGAAAPGVKAKPGKPSSAKAKPGTSAAPVPKLTWKAPAKGGGKGKPKRWTRHPGTRAVPTAKQPSTKGTAKRIGQARRVTWKAQKGTKATKGPQRWTPPPPSSTRRGGGSRPRRKAARTRKTWKAQPKSKTTRSGTTRGAKARKRWTASSGATSGAAPGGGNQSRTSTPPPPPPGFEGMRPPPGADRTVRVTVERVDSQTRQEPQQARPAPLALTEGSLPMLNPALPSTQYDDAELTIHDVIEADADMAEEITDGVVEAQRTAAGCDALLDRLEALHAKVVELRVPGVLEGLVVRLMEQTAVVKARAEAIGENLPRAAEAISIAGSNAAARHKPLADAVRDAGHIRPAEREYHQE